MILQCKMLVDHITPRDRVNIRSHGSVQPHFPFYDGYGIAGSTLEELFVARSRIDNALLMKCKLGFMCKF